MPVNLGKLYVEIEADAAGLVKAERQTQASTTRMSRHLGKARSAAARFGLALGAAGVGYGVVRGLQSTIRAYGQFDDAMNQSLAIMGNVSEAMRRDMSQAAREMAKVSRFSANQAAESYFYLASAGLDAKASIQALPVVTRFAQAGMFDMARATDLLTDAQSALGLTVRDNAVANMENMVHVSDALVKANTLANASVAQFSEALTNKGAAALRMVNKELAEGLAVLAAYADQGLKGAAAGDALNIVLRDLQTASIKNRKEFKNQGIAVFDTLGTLRNMADIVGDLERVLAGMSDEQKRTTLTLLGFQDRSVAYINTLLGMADAIREYEAALKKAAGTTKEISDKQLDSFSSRMDILGSKFKDAGISIGKLFVPAIEQGSKVLGGLLDAIRAVTEYPQPIELEVKVTGVSDAAGRFFPIQAQKGLEQSATRMQEDWEKIQLVAGGQKSQLFRTDLLSDATRELIDYNAGLLDLEQEISVATRVADEAKTAFQGMKRAISWGLDSADIEKLPELYENLAKAQARLNELQAEREGIEYNANLKEEYETKKKLRKEEDARNKVAQRALGIIRSVRTAEEELLAAETALADAVAAGVITVDEKTQALIRLEKQLKGVEEEEKKVGKMAEQMSWAAASAFEEAILQAESFRDVLKGLLDDITRIILRLTVIKPLEGALSGMLSGIFAGVGGGVGGDTTLGGLPAGPTGTGWGSYFSSLKKTDGMPFSVPGPKFGQPAPMTVTVIDQRSQGEPVKVQETIGVDGRRQLDMIIRDRVMNDMNGGPLERQMRSQFGLMRKSVSR